jgi:hypothetical protein
MSLLDSIKRWFGARQEPVDDVPAPGPERADATLEQERRERAADPRPSLAEDEGYEAGERERQG